MQHTPKSFRPDSQEILFRILPLCFKLELQELPLQLDGNPAADCSLLSPGCRVEAKQVVSMQDWEDLAKRWIMDFIAILSSSSLLFFQKLERSDGSSG